LKFELEIHYSETRTKKGFVEIEAENETEAEQKFFDTDPDVDYEDTTDERGGGTDIEVYHVRSMEK